MRRWLKQVAILVGCGFLSSCAADKTPFLKPPDLLEQVANADLSAPRPTYGSAQNGGPNGVNSQNPRRPRFEKYPGDNHRSKRRQPLSGISPSENGYELNFADASLSELAKVILRDTLSIPYIFDPRVKGTVTLSTGGPISKEQLLSLLETVVGMNRAILIRGDQGYQIIPESEGRRRGTALQIDYASELREVGAGYGVSVIPLKYMSSDAALRMLETFVGSRNVLRASVINNLLVVRGDGKTRRSIVEVTAMFDVDWMRGQSAGIYTLRNASPAELIQELKRIFGADGRAKNLVRFSPLDRLNAILVLTQNSEYLNDVGKWVARLDREGSDGDDYYVYRIENGKAKELADILNATFSGSGTATSARGAEEDQVASTEAATQVNTPRSATARDDEEPAPLGDTASNERNTLNVTKSSFAPTSFSSSQNGEVRIIPDVINNKLLIKAPARIYRKMLNVLRRIDKPPLQVLINATLAEVRLNDNLQYGVQFYLQNNSGLNKAFGFSNGPAINIAPAVPGLNFIVGSTIANANVILDALAQETAVRIVSSPSVVVLHNQSATLQVGDEVPISTRQSNSVIDPQAPVVNEIQYRDTGVILKVTPRVNSNGLVTMEVEQEISLVSNSSSDGGTLTPTISQRKIASTIAVQDGQMVILGGLISEQLDREKSRVPIIREIPYLGDVVGNSDHAKSRTELVVFLKPRVIRKPVDAAHVAEELRARMQSLAPRPAPWDESRDESRHERRNDNLGEKGGLLGRQNPQPMMPYQLKGDREVNQYR